MPLISVGFFIDFMIATGVSGTNSLDCNAFTSITGDVLEQRVGEAKLQYI